MKSFLYVVVGVLVVALLEALTVGAYALILGLAFGLVAVFMGYPVSFWNMFGLGVVVVIVLSTIKQIFKN